MAVLPTKEDTFKAYYELAFNNNFDYNYSQCVEHISEQIISIYGKTSLKKRKYYSIITINIINSEKRLIVRLRNLNIQIIPENIKKTPEKFTNGVDSMKKLFDTCSCKCISKGAEDR